MEWRYQYKSNSEKDELIEKNKSLYLIREENITEGNFIIFSDAPLPEPVVYMNVPEAEFKALKESDVQNKEAIAALYEMQIGAGPDA